MKDNQLIVSFLHSLQVTSHCSQLSLYLPEKISSKAQASLTHLFESQLVPELKTITSAGKFLATKHSQLQALLDINKSCEIFSSESDTCVLVAMSLNQNKLQHIASASTQKVNIRKIPSAIENDFIWLGFKFRDHETLSRVMSDFLTHQRSLSDSNEPFALLCRLFVKTLHDSLCNQQLLQDPQTLLIGRYQLHQHMEQRLEQETRQTLFLINPDQFNRINQLFDQASGDTVLREFATRLANKFRQNDIVARYGGATFAILIADISLEDAHSLAKSLHVYLTDKAYLDGAVSLKVNIGIACLETKPSDSPQDATQLLIQRAEQALNSANSYPDTDIATWHEDAELNFWQGIDRLGGIFTAKPETDYRNMLLLWNIVEIIGTENQLEPLLSRFLKRLYDTFKPQRMAIINCLPNQEWEIIDGLSTSVDTNNTEPNQTEIELGTKQIAKVNALIKLQELALPASFDWRAGDNAYRCLIMPMISSGQLQGILYFESPKQQWTIDANDERFIQAFAHQLGAGIIRLKLQQQFLEEQQQERLKLEQEVEGLRASFEESRIIYCSEVMEKLLKRTSRIATSSATVLVSGESGTGKELLAETVHQMGPRREKPLVIVDCSSIPESLIESELFGHCKGAFTGATQASSGRILEADGGTLILDEIGELPLHVQAKFLRFVQEKQVSAVGSTTTVQVDVTLVAVTNRDLGKEVAAGRFREDLFYRLNVMVLIIPPLRDRLDDIPMLLQHFNKRFARQFKTTEKVIDMELCRKLQDFHWPGNIRELQNRMMQAVILCEQEQLSFQDFELPNQCQLNAGLDQKANNLKAGLHTSNIQNLNHGVKDHFQALSESLKLLIIHIVDSDISLSNSLGEWLEAELVLAAYERVDRVERRAARILGATASTIRRKIKRAQRLPEERITLWEPIKQLAVELVASTSADDGVELLKQAENILFKQLSTLLVDSPDKAAELLGIGEVTFKRRLCPQL